MRRLAPSPSMVVALIALFLSLGGVSYGVATGFIDSRELKNNTVSTNDLKNNDIRSGDVRANALTGADINENSLGKVASAGTADSAANAANATNAANAANATTAANASTVNGFTIAKIDYRAATGTSGTTILNVKGLTITVDCTANQIDNLDVTGPPGTNISVWGYDGDDTTEPLNGALDIEGFVGGTLQNVEDVLGDTSANSVGATLVYHRNNGDVVTAQFNLEEDNPPVPCVIGGAAVAG